MSAVMSVMSVIFYYHITGQALFLVSAKRARARVWGYDNRKPLTSLTSLTAPEPASGGCFGYQATEMMNKTSVVHDE